VDLQPAFRQTPKRCSARRALLGISELKEKRRQLTGKVESPQARLWALGGHLGELPCAAGVGMIVAERVFEVFGS
jgi:hypothetical protein